MQVVARVLKTVPRRRPPRKTERLPKMLEYQVGIGVCFATLLDSIWIPTEVTPASAGVVQHNRLAGGSGVMRSKRRRRRWGTVVVCSLASIAFIAFGTYFVWARHSGVPERIPIQSCHKHSGSRASDVFINYVFGDSCQGSPGTQRKEGTWSTGACTGMTSVTMSTSTSHGAPGCSTKLSTTRGSCRRSPSE